MPQQQQAGVSTRLQNMPIGGVQMAIRGVNTRAESGGIGGGDAPAARFELVFSTGAAVRRYDWNNGRYYMEELVVEPGSINLDRLERGAPLLDTHWAMSLACQLGVVDQPDISAGRGTVQAQLSRREDVRGVVQDLEDGVIRNVSVGYSRDAIEMVAPTEENGMWVYRVTKWTPVEVSLVPIPADMDSQVVRSADGTLQDNQGRELRTFPCSVVEVRADVCTPQQQPQATPGGSQTPTAGAQAETRSTTTGEIQMPQANATGGGNTPAAQNTNDDARAAGVQAERQRQADIRTAADAAAATLGREEADRLARGFIDLAVTADEARRQLLDALAQRSQAQQVRGSAPNIETTRDEVETARNGMADAIALRVRPNATALADHAINADGARRFRGMDLLDMARRSITLAGGNADGLSRREIALAALNIDSDARRAAGMHSTSDFPNVLATTVNRMLRAAYEAAPRTFTGWARESANKDFREKAVLQLSGMSAMQKVNEGGEYKAMTFSDTAEKYSLSKYGGIVSITWESIINDDLGAFDRIPTMIAEEAAALEGDLVYAALTGSVTMSDTVALFHASHGNLAGSGAAITDVTLAAARAAMRKQTGINGRVLNLEPAFLIVGPDKEGEAYKYTSTNYVAAKNADINPAFNTALTVVVDSRISGNNWYLGAAPTRVDTVEYAYLEGERGLFTQRREGFEVDGLQVKARHVFAAKAIDHRGLYKNPGA